MKYVYIVNPVSGKKNAEKTLVPEIHEYFKDKDLDYEVVLTERPHHATELARSCASSGDEVRICSCGGDGTLNEVVEGVVGHDNVELSCYSCGGGNDFVKSFGSVSDFRRVATLVEGDSVPVDVLTVNDRYCINILSVGLDADISEAVIKYRKVKFLRGPGAYNLAMLECVFLKPMGKDFTVELDGKEPYSNSFTLVVAGNGRVYGGSYRATPEAKVDDGIIDIVSIKKLSLPKVAKLISKYKAGVHIKDGVIIDELVDKMEYYKTAKFKISAQNEFVVNIDGERIRTDCIQVGIIRHALKFIVPDLG